MNKAQIDESATAVQPNKGAEGINSHKICMALPLILMAVFSVLVFALLAAPAVQDAGISLNGYDILQDTRGALQNCLIALMVFAGLSLVIVAIMTSYLYFHKGRSSEYVYAIIPIFFAEMISAIVFYGLAVPTAGEAILALAILALLFAVISALCTIIDRGVFKRNCGYAFCRYLPFNLMIVYLFLIFIFLGTFAFELGGSGLSGYQYLLLKGKLEGIPSLKASMICFIVFAALGSLLIVVQGYYYSGETTVGQHIVVNCIVTCLLYLVEAVIAMVMIIQLRTFKVGDLKMPLDCGALPIAILTLSLSMIIVTIVCAVFTSKKSITKFALLPGMGTIESYSFSNCIRLEEVVIPRSVKVIEGYGFWGCRALTSIRYEGTKAEWEEIVKKQNWSANTGDYKIDCSDGEIKN